MIKLKKRGKAKKGLKSGMKKIVKERKQIYICFSLLFHILYSQHLINQTLCLLRKCFKTETVNYILLSQ
jgi:hypothetical protein